MGRKKIENENIEKNDVEKLEKFIENSDEVDSRPDLINLDESEVLKYRLINTQFNLIKKSIENAEMQKQMFSSERKIVLESFEDFKTDICEKYSINYDDYIIDLEKQKLIKKQQ